MIREHDDLRSDGVDSRIVWEVYRGRTVMIASIEACLVHIGHIVHHLAYKI